MSGFRKQLNELEEWRSARKREFSERVVIVCMGLLLLIGSVAAVIGACQ